LERFTGQAPSPAAMHTATLTHNGQIIPYSITRSARRRKTIAIGVDPQRGVWVRAPLRVSQAEIARLTRARADWIVSRLARLPSPPPHARQEPGAAPPPPAVPTGSRNGATVFVLGAACVVRHETTPLLQDRGFCQQHDTTLTIALPADPATQPALAQAALVGWYQQRAATVLGERTRIYAAASGLQPQRILIRAQKARWGSCDRHNTIRYNWQLVTLPLDLLDYVVVHELCHIAEKNHSKAFWQRVAAILPDYQQRRRQLRQTAAQYVFREDVL